jgi:hypothetical protein
LQPDQQLVAHVALKDGRVLDLPTIIGTPRPKMTLINKSIQLGSTPTGISLAGQDALPLDGEISFLLKTDVPAKLTRSEKVEVASTDEGFSAMLSLADGSLVLRDSETLVAVLAPRKAFGPSAFGPMRFRPIAADGTKGDWQPLATIVRVPSLKDLRCPESVDKPCELTGTNLFLIDSVASDPQFTHTVPVPIGFIDSKLDVPHPGELGLFIKLRDDPAAVNTATLAISLEPEDKPNQ